MALAIKYYCFFCSYQCTYVYDYKSSNSRLEPQIIMSKCFEHKTTFPETHRHIRPAIEIFRNVLIVCKGLELKNSNLKTTFAWMYSLCFGSFQFTEDISCNYVKNKGYPMHNSELRLHLNFAFYSPCVFTHGVQMCY